MSEHSRKQTLALSSAPILIPAQATANGHDQISHINDAKISSTVQEVVRNICYGPRAPLLLNGNTLSKRVSGVRINHCLSPMVQSISNNDHCSFVKTAPVVYTNGSSINDDKMDNGQQGSDDMEPPPKLLAMNEDNSEFEQYSKKRRIRRLFTRRPPRRCPIKLTPANGDVDQIRAIRPRPKRPQNRPPKDDYQKTGPKQNGKTNIPSLDAQIHSSVFAPDRCRLLKMNNRRKNQLDLDDKVSNSVCWHALLNGALLSSVHKFNGGDIKYAKSWSVDTVSEFLKILPGCPQAIAEKFREEQIDGEAFLLLTRNDIITLMNIRLGPAIKIHNAIMLLKHLKNDHGIKV